MVIMDILVFNLQDPTFPCNSVLPWGHDPTPQNVFISLHLLLIPFGLFLLPLEA